jgi:hypothetical protein
MTLLKDIEKVILIAKGHEYIGEICLDINDAQPHTEEFYRVKNFERRHGYSSAPKQDEIFYEALQLADLPSCITEIIPNSLVSSSPSFYETGKIYLDLTIKKIIDECYFDINSCIESKYKAKRVLRKMHGLVVYYGTSRLANESKVAVEEIIRLYCLIKSESPNKEKIRKMILSSPGAKLATKYINK